MQIKSYGVDTLVARITRAAKEAHDRGEIIYGVDITAEEYKQLRKELEEDGEMTHVPPHDIPLYVDGKSKAQEMLQRFSLRSLEAPAGKPN